MEYNDIIIILLLVVIIGLMLIKKEYVHFKNSENNNQYNNQQNYMPIQKPINTQSNYANTQLNNRHIAKNYNINDRLENIKKTKNSSPIIIKTNQDSEQKKININNKFIHKNVVHKNNIDSYDDLGSLDDISLKQLNNKKINNKKTKNQLKNSNNTQENRKMNKLNDKVIIDDYSEFDNIKSLNSMDNTLSDIVSIVEKD